jgi:hypothetical protein
MKPQTTTSQFLLLGQGTHWDKGLSPEEIQKLLGRAHIWFDQLIQQGKAKGGQRLRGTATSVLQKRRYWIKRNSQLAETTVRHRDGTKPRSGI